MLLKSINQASKHSSLETTIYFHVDRIRSLRAASFLIEALGKSISTSLEYYQLNTENINVEIKDHIQCYSDFNCFSSLWGYRGYLNEVFNSVLIYINSFVKKTRKNTGVWPVSSAWSPWNGSIWKYFKNSEVFERLAVFLLSKSHQ